MGLSSIFSNIVYAIAICLSMCYIFLWSFLFGRLSISLFFTVHSPNKNNFILNFERKENYLIFQSGVVHKLRLQDEVGS